jgi:uncharacterized protein
MPDGGESITIRLVEHISDVPAADWDACAGTANPFLSYAFLSTLEASRSSIAETGWAPRHVIAEDSAGRVIGVVPMYLKSHSYGEYVFDHGWADAYRRAGGSYYPKFQVAVPFTPVPGPRLLVRQDYGDAVAVQRALIDSLAEISERSSVSSLHCTFCTAEEAAAFEKAGWLIRHGVQYHWSNNGYKTFDDFLAAMSHSRRKSIRRERRDVAAQGLVVEVLTGDALELRHWDKFYEFYMATGDRKWGRPYLTRDFFRRLNGMANRVALVMASKDGEYVAGALNLIGEDTLYGRNWGSYGEYPFLHFEACYYKAIEFAIQRGLAKVEAGAQGEHKIQRGYLPVTTYSAHWIGDPGFRKAVADFCKRERTMMKHEANELATLSPFKETPGDTGG